MRESSMKRMFFSTAGYVVLILSVTLFSGCKEPVTLAPVSGKVTFGDQALTSGQVTLVPADSTTLKEVPGGTIDSNGEYKIFTGGREGAPLGKYKVTVNIAMMPSGDNKPPIMGFDRKYTDAKSTPLHYEVVSNPSPGAYDLKVTK
jgi:hypothetical protein